MKKTVHSLLKSKEKLQRRKWRCRAVLRASVKYFSAVLLIFLAGTSFAQADTADSALTSQTSLSQQINDNRAAITKLQDNINSLTEKIATTQAAAAQEARAVQVSNPTTSFVNQLFSAETLTQLIQRIVSINIMVTATNQKTIELQNAKAAQTKAMNDLKVAQVQLDQQEQQMRNSLSSQLSAGTQLPSQYTDQVQQASPDSSVSDAQALANIIARESGGNPNAENGIMKGIGQLMASYYPMYVGQTWEQCRGNYGIQLQAMQAYIASRYGNATNAWAWWQGHGWY